MMLPGALNAGVFSYTGFAMSGNALAVAVPVPICDFCEQAPAPWFFTCWCDALHTPATCVLNLVPALKVRRTSVAAAGLLFGCDGSVDEMFVVMPEEEPGLWF